MIGLKEDRSLLNSNVLPSLPLTMSSISVSFFTFYLLYLLSVQSLGPKLSAITEVDHFRPAQKR